MSKVPVAEVFRLAKQAGFDDVQARIMTAIAGAESGYNADAVGDVALENGTWGPSVGLWQIRTLKADTGTGRTRDRAHLQGNGLAQAFAARVIFQQQGYKAWSTYTNQSYRAFLGDANKAASGVEYAQDTGGKTPLGAATGAVGGALYNAGGAAVDAAGGALTGINAIGHFFASLSERGTWVRVLQVVGGTALVAGGLAVMGLDVAKPLAGAALDVLPAGKAVKAAGAVAAATS